VESFIRDLEVASASKPRPSVRLMKINVDAAVKKTCKSGAIAAVCRAMNRDFLGASSVVVHGIGDPAALTAMACRDSRGPSFSC
jgi:hypothetical protein